MAKWRKRVRKKAEAYDEQARRLEEIGAETSAMGAKSGAAGRS